MLLFSFSGTALSSFSGSYSSPYYLHKTNRMLFCIAIRHLYFLRPFFLPNSPFRLRPEADSLRCSLGEAVFVRPQRRPQTSRPSHVLNDTGEWPKILFREGRHDLREVHREEEPSLEVSKREASPWEPAIAFAGLPVLDPYALERDRAEPVVCDTEG